MCISSMQIHTPQMIYIYISIRNAHPQTASIEREKEREREMGNSIGGGRKKAKVMKINGETLKLKTPIQAWDVVKGYPGHVLLESEEVKKFGIRAKPLKAQQELKPKKTYFLVELPKQADNDDEKEKLVTSRRTQSGVHLSAKDRLECLMLSRRSVSDLTMMRSTTTTSRPPAGPVRVKVKLPKAQLVKLVEESRDGGGEVAEKIIDLYIGRGLGEADEGLLLHQQGMWKPGLGSIRESLQAC